MNLIDASFCSEICDFLNEFDWLIMNHSVDFFLLDFDFKQFKVLSKADLTDLISFATHKTVKQEWGDFVFNFAEKQQSLLLNNIVQKTEIKPTEIDKKISIGMDDKKRIEVSSLSAIINNYAEKHAITHIIDLGAGQGYLDACLAYQYNRNVLGIDDSAIQTCGAVCNMKKIQKSFKNNHNLTFINSHIDSGQEISQILNQPENRLYFENEPKWILCGLHTCGDLSSNMIRQFIHSDARVLVNVGCCYNLLSNSSKDLVGFPMSKFLSDKKYKLDYTKLQAACQAPCRWERDYENTLFNFKKNSWRALLQVILVKEKLLSGVDPDFIKLGKLCKSAFKKDFNNYVQYACLKLNIKISNHIVEKYEKEYESEMNKVAVLWTLRALMGQVVESLIIADRVLALKESGQCENIKLLSLCDSIISPRNIVIIAEKNLDNKSLNRFPFF
jgi:hypothetical protein